MFVEVKESIFDMVAHIKEQWSPNSQMLALYDGLIKDMVVKGGLDFQTVFDFVRVFVQLIDAQLGQQTHTLMNATTDL